MQWLVISLNWYFYLFILGLIFFPITFVFFRKFSDRGYAFSKTIGIVIVSYLLFTFGTLRIVPFERSSIFFILGCIALLNFYFVFKHRRTFSRNLISIIIFEEILFISAFLFLAYVRGQEPSIRSLEKFMDFGFINAILKSRYFPPLDMWLSADLAKPQGYPINYYYFGHLTAAFLIKLSNIKSSLGYNFLLATIFAQGITLSFSLIYNIIFLLQKHLVQTVNHTASAIIGVIGSLIINLGGNLHPIYLFTKGYPNDNPLPFWQIFSSYNPAKYWYPNATRFIPFTIHEFPSYSYVVADLHGHVFDIPFVLVTLAVLFHFFVSLPPPPRKPFGPPRGNRVLKNHILNTKYVILYTFVLGFLLSIHYMTNAFDGLIYFALSVIIAIILFQTYRNVVAFSGLLIVSAVLFTLPFSLFFTPFASKIALNCSPDFLANIGSIGPFLFEKDKCQVSPFWMLFVLWGFFWIQFAIFMGIRYVEFKILKKTQPALFHWDFFIFVLFSFGTFLVIIPEFFYIKDIYPAHFRANTMFKLGYQAFVILGIASAYTLFRLKLFSRLKHSFSFLAIFLFVISFSLIMIYPFTSFPSYYGSLDKTPEFDGSVWVSKEFPEDKAIIDFLNKNIKKQPVILEAQGDSYTDYGRISAYTGLPTVGGWLVHEWLWRGSSDVVGKRSPDISSIYESLDIAETKKLLKKYLVQFVIVSRLEKEKYKKLNEKKFEEIGKKIFVSPNKKGAVYQVNLDTY